MLGTFLEDICVLADDVRATAGDEAAAKLRTTAASLYAAYGDWCQTTGTQALSQTAFSRRLSERGFQPYRTTAGRGWIGIGIRHRDGDGS